MIRLTIVPWTRSGLKPQSTNSQKIVKKNKSIIFHRFKCSILSPQQDSPPHNHRKKPPPLPPQTTAAATNQHRRYKPLT